jgi:hypothetical protein
MLVFSYHLMLIIWLNYFLTSLIFCTGLINHLGLLFACLGELETMPSEYAEQVCN